MLNARHRVNSQYLPAFHLCNLLHHLRTMFAAPPLLEYQRHILTLRELDASNVQDLCAPETHFGERREIQPAQGPCIRYKARVGGADTIDLLDDFTAFGFQRRGHSYRGGVAAASAE